METKIALCLHCTKHTYLVFYVHVFNMDNPENADESKN